VQHRLAAGAMLAVLAVAAAGCGGSSGEAPLAGASPSASASPNSSGSPSGSGGAAGATATAATRTINVRVRGGKVTPAPGQVSVASGTRVLLTVVSDRPDEVHVHGYNVEMEIKAGVPGTLSFVADQPGRVEVETHKSGLTLFELITR